MFVLFGLWIQIGDIIRVLLGLCGQLRLLLFFQLLELDSEQLWWWLSCMGLFRLVQDFMVQRLGVFELMLYEIKGFCLEVVGLLLVLFWMQVLKVLVGEYVLQFLNQQNFWYRVLFELVYGQFWRYRYIIFLFVMSIYGWLVEVLLVQCMCQYRLFGIRLLVGQ